MIHNLDAHPPSRFDTPAGEHNARLTVLPFAGTEHPAWCTWPAGGCTGFHETTEVKRSCEDYVYAVKGYRSTGVDGDWLSLVIVQDRGSVALTLLPEEAALLRLHLERVEATLREGS